MQIHGQELWSALANGGTTLAELEGMTAAEAYAIADFGWMLLGQGRIADAAVVFEMLTLSNPHHAYFHALYGAALQRSGTPDAALDAYDRALSLDPGETSALVNRAELLLGRGSDADVAEAARLLESAIALDPGVERPETRRARGLIAAAVERIGAEGIEAASSVI